MNRWEEKEARKNYERHDFLSGTFRVIVMTSHIDYPGEWVMSCYELNINAFELKVSSAEKAKQKAKKLITARLEKMLASAKEM